MPEFFAWLLDEFRFIRPSPGAMSWHTPVELGDTSGFYWLHWECHISKLVKSVRAQDVWIERDEFGDVGETVIETLESWLQEQRHGGVGA